MLTLIRNAELYTPEPLGRGDILTAGERIAAIAPRLDGYAALDGVRVLDADGLCAAPGIIDLHAHVTGGGGEAGFASRVPESRLTDFTLCGVTTVVGLLGTDGVTRSLENLYAKVCALHEEGMTAYMLTGSYAYPSPTLTGSVERDLLLIDRVVGVKLALADHRGSHPTDAEFLRLCSQARRGGLLSSKPGLVVLHMGDGGEGLDKAFYALEHAPVPPATLLPTHVDRSPRLLEQAAALTRRGMTVDCTAEGDGTTAALLREQLNNGADWQHVTLSSDAFGSRPAFDAAGVCTGMTYGAPSVLWDELCSLVRTEGMPLEQALLPLTRNPARVLGKADAKGALSVGADADILLMDGDMRLRHVFARGRQMMRDGVAVVKGRFEP